MLTPLQPHLGLRVEPGQGSRSGVLSLFGPGLSRPGLSIHAPEMAPGRVRLCNKVAQRYNARVCWGLGRCYFSLPRPRSLLPVLSARPVLALTFTMSPQCPVQTPMWRQRVELSGAGVPPPPPPALQKGSHWFRPAALYFVCWVLLNGAQKLVRDVPLVWEHRVFQRLTRTHPRHNALGASGQFHQSCYSLLFPPLTPISGISGTLSIFESRGCFEPLLLARLPLSGLQSSQRGKGRRDGICPKGAGPESQWLPTGNQESCRDPQGSRHSPGSVYLPD